MHCTSCGADVPQAVADAPFCAFCGARHEVDEPPVSPGVASAPSSIPARPRQIFRSDSHQLPLAFDPTLGFLLIGLSGYSDGPLRLRAYDIVGQRIVWESLAGLSGLDDVGGDRLAVRRTNVFVNVDRSLHVLDLRTGQPKWSAEFSDRLTTCPQEGQGGLAIHDPIPAGQRAAIVVETLDHALSALDRDTGQQAWRDARESSTGDAILIEALGQLVFTGTGQIMSPFLKAPVATLKGGGPERCAVYGTLAVLHVRHWGWLDREGVLLWDLAANKEVFFDTTPDPTERVPGVLANGRVLFAVESGAKLASAPNGKAVELMAGFTIDAITLCGPTLFALVVKKAGTRYRHILGVDPGTLSVRFDLGELEGASKMCTDGSVVFVVVELGKGYEVWGVDATGRVLWKAPVDHGPFGGHVLCLLGGHVLVQTSKETIVFQQGDGHVVGRYRDP